jgi:hypothetical protein
LTLSAGAPAGSSSTSGDVAVLVVEFHSPVQLDDLLAQGQAEAKAGQLTGLARRPEALGEWPEGGGGAVLGQRPAMIADLQTDEIAVGVSAVPDRNAIGNS